MTLHGPSHKRDLHEQGFVTQGWSSCYLISAAFVCDGCQGMVIGRVQALRDTVDRSKVDESFWRDAVGIDWLPKTVGGKEFPDVPPHIASAASEAYECRSIGAYRGAVALARAVVEATAKEKGITEGSLFEKIKAMKDQGLIRSLIAEAAHEVRHWGNDSVHGDFIDTVSAEEADEILELMSVVLDGVFITPARVAAVQAARLAKKAPM